MFKSRASSTIVVRQCQSCGKLDRVNMTAKRGNPNWGKPWMPEAGPQPSQFEHQIKRLGLTKETCAGSADLRRWCEKNKNRCYIPEWLLALWRLDVDPNVSAS
jgi:hypothetical protein